MTDGGRPFDVMSLELLVTIGAWSSISRAAREVGLSQPSASLRLAELERRIGSPLVERSTSGSRLTAVGATVAEWAAEVISASEAFSRQVRSLTAAPERRLTIAVSKTVADNLLPDWLVAMHAGAPEVTVALEMRDPADVVDRVREGSSEIGFAEAHGAVRGLRSCALGRDELMVVVAPGHPLTRGAAPSIAELAAIPLVLREEGCGSRAALLRALGREGLAPTIAAELASTAAIKSLVIGGGGVTVLSSLSVRADLAEGRLVALPLQDGPLVLPFRAMWRRGPGPIGPARELIEIALRAGGDARLQRSRRASPPASVTPR